MNIGMPTDPTIGQNAENLNNIEKAVTKPHWSTVPMFWMTLMILLLTSIMNTVSIDNKY